MKKLLLLLTLLCVFSISLFAQSSSSAKTGKWNFGLDLGLPLGDLHDAYSSVIGASVKYEYPLSTSTFVTLSAGYNRYLFTDYLKQYFKSFGENRTSKGMIPIKIGVKHYFGGNLFVDGQIGREYSTQKNGGSSFIYAPGVGYTFKNGFEAGVSFNGYRENNSNSSVAALRLGFRF